jgi:hypothetical protein
MSNHKRGWSQADDDLLMDLIAEDIPFREIAPKLGRTRNACIGRWHRLYENITKGKWSQYS